MLDESSYEAAMAVYLVAGAVAAILFAIFIRRWLPRSWPLWGALGAALLLTPAYADSSATTMAPAVIVAGFEWLTHGPEAAEHAVRPLVYALGIALAVGLPLSLLVARRLRRAQVSDDAHNTAEDAE